VVAAVAVGGVLTPCRRAAVTGGAGHRGRGCTFGAGKADAVPT